MWCRSAVRRSFGFLFAACRIRATACDTLARHWVRDVLWPSGFPLVEALSSGGSAAAPAPLFAALTGPTASSDFFKPCVIGFGFLHSQRGPVCDSRGSLKTSQGPDRRLADVHGFSDTTGFPDISPKRCLRCCLQRGRKPRHPGQQCFRCSIARPSVPLPTLRLPPHGCRRTARGETWLGYAFVPGDFHPLPPASSPGRTSLALPHGGGRGSTAGGVPNARHLLDRGHPALDAPPAKSGRPYGTNRAQAAGTGRRKHPLYHSACPFSLSPLCTMPSPSVGGWAGGMDVAQAAGGGRPQAADRSGPAAHCKA